MTSRFLVRRADQAGPAVPEGWADHSQGYSRWSVVDESTAAVHTGVGDCALLPVGVPHAWSNRGGVVARWADMLAPQPRERFGGDTFFVPPLPAAGSQPLAVDVRDPRTRSFGHIEPANMEPGRQTQDLLAVSASMRTALLVYSGISVKMMVDSD